MPSKEDLKRRAGEIIDSKADELTALAKTILKNPEPGFREVKTGAIFLPAQRVESSPGRHTLLRRVLVTCLGSADQIFDRVWSKLQELSWLGKNTRVVIIGDGAEWIWNRASMFPRRCEIAWR